MHILICCAVTGTQITTLNIDYANDINVLLVDVFCSYSQKYNLLGIKLIKCLNLSITSTLLALVKMVFCVVGFREGIFF